MMTSKENKRKGRNYCSTSDIATLLRQKCQRTTSRDNDNGDNVDISSKTVSPTVPITSSTKLPLCAKKGHSIPRDKRPVSPPSSREHQTHTTSRDNDNGDDVDITSKTLSPTVPVTSSTKLPLSAKKGHSITRDKRPVSPPSSREHQTHTTSRDNDNGDDVDITSKTLSPTVPVTSSTKLPLSAKKGHFIPRDKKHAAPSSFQVHQEHTTSSTHPPLTAKNGNCVLRLSLIRC